MPGVVQLFASSRVSAEREFAVGSIGRRAVTPLGRACM